MAYSSGMLEYRVQVARRVTDPARTFGDRGATGGKYEILGTFNMAENFNKGMKSLREGALDAYDTVMFRMRWNPFVSRDSQLQYEGVTYQIMSFHADKMANTIQITAQELVK